MSCCNLKGECTQALNCVTRGSYQPRLVTIDAIGEPRRVVYLGDQPTTLQAPDRRNNIRGPRSCQAHGICKGRYPACGQCDDAHPEDEPPTPSPFEQIYCWCIAAAIAAAAVAGVGLLALAAGATVHFVAKLWPL